MGGWVDDSREVTGWSGRRMCYSPAGSLRTCYSAKGLAVPRRQDSPGLVLPPASPFFLLFLWNSEEERVRRRIHQRAAGRASAPPGRIRLAISFPCRAAPLSFAWPWCDHRETPALTGFCRWLSARLALQPGVARAIMLTVDLPRVLPLGPSAKGSRGPFRYGATGRREGTRHLVWNL